MVQSKSHSQIVIYTYFKCIEAVGLKTFLQIKWLRERAKNEQQQQFLLKVTKTCKINPEGTCGLTWPEMVPLN